MTQPQVFIRKNPATRQDPGVPLFAIVRNESCFLPHLLTHSRKP